MRKQGLVLAGVAGNWEAWDWFLARGCDRNSPVPGVGTVLDSWLSSSRPWGGL